jgi:hypothetical protein
MEQFEQFCNKIIKSLIKPQVTVVSGNNSLQSIEKEIRII